MQGINPHVNDKYNSILQSVIFFDGIKHQMRGIFIRNARGCDPVSYPCVVSQAIHHVVANNMNMQIHQPVRPHARDCAVRCRHWDHFPNVFSGADGAGGDTPVHPQSSLLSPTTSSPRKTLWSTTTMTVGMAPRWCGALAWNSQYLGNPLIVVANKVHKTDGIS